MRRLQRDSKPNQHVKNTFIWINSKTSVPFITACSLFVSEILKFNRNQNSLNFVFAKLKQHHTPCYKCLARFLYFDTNKAIAKTKSIQNSHWLRLQIQTTSNCEIELRLSLPFNTNVITVFYFQLILWTSRRSRRFVKYPAATELLPVAELMDELCGLSLPCIWFTKHWLYKWITEVYTANYSGNKMRRRNMST